MESKNTVRSYYIIRAMEDHCKGGDTYITEDALYALCRSKYSRLTFSAFRNDLAEQIRLKGISREGRRLYLPLILKYENTVAHILKGLLADNTLPLPDQPENLTVNGLTLAPEQCAAVQTAIGHRLSIILGGAGCGKTTLIEAIVNSCPGVDPLDRSYVLCAPTGKASCILTARTGLPARTIHSALRKFPDEDFLELGVVNWDGVKLVIVDEASMMSLEHLAGVLYAAKRDCRIVLVGDPNQLRSVGAGNVLADLLTLGVPCAQLKTCHRQSDTDSALAYNVREFSRCRRFSDLHFDDSFVFIPTRSEEEIHARICIEAARLYKEGADIQVLSPLNKGSLSVSSFNHDLQDKINPASADNIISDIAYRNDDRVIILKNDWSQHVCNGDVGHFSCMDSGNHFSFRVACSGERSASWDDKRYLKLIRLAYAVTIHKSQGSEYEVVILPVTHAFDNMLYQNLIYTAISRSRKKVIIVGDPDALDMALQKETPERKSMLVQKTHMLLHKAV